MFEVTIKTPEGCYWRRSGVFIVNFVHISHIVLVSTVSILNFEHGIAGRYTYGEGKCQLKIESNKDNHPNQVNYYFRFSDFF